MGQKRPRSETMDAPSGQSPFASLFEGFRKELDEHHERRERVVKRSRDITAASKKIIFGLQRARSAGQPLTEAIGKAIKPHRDAVVASYVEAAKDLQGSNGWRYSRNITGGNQEYVEAATFARFLTHGRLLTYDEARQDLLNISSSSSSSSSEGASATATETTTAALTEEFQGVDLSVEDYILGLLDMTGELMRFAITIMATTGEVPTATNGNGNCSDKGEDDTVGSKRTVLSDLRALRSGLEGLEVRGQASSWFARDMEKKMEVMRTSVEKVERALYGLVVRGAERPKGWMPELDAGGGGGREVDVEG